MAANKQAKQKLLLDALRAGNTITAAVAYAGIHVDTYYEWKKEPKFSEEIKRALATAEMRAVTGIVKAGGKSWQALAWWLTHHPNTKAAWRQISELNWRDLTVEQLLALAGNGPEGAESPGDRLATTGADGES